MGKYLFCIIINILTVIFICLPIYGLPISEEIFGRCITGNCYDGEGKRSYEDGSLYCGKFLSGRRHGKGQMHYPDGSMFYGNWEYDKKSGEGMSVFADGSEFKGNFLNDEPDGIGIFISADGSMKKAVFKNGKLISCEKIEFEKKNGPYQYGTVLTLGGVYTGWYIRNAASGVVPQKRGRIRWDDGSIYMGQWKDGKMHGRGMMKWSDGATYEGEWNEGRRSGFGIYTWKSGTRYMGQWKDNRKHGYGIAVYPDGTILKGFFRDDVFVGN